MGTYTRLETRDVEEIARAFSIGEVESWRVIPAGCINSNFAVATSGGRFFLRVNEDKCEADVRFESDLVQALARAGVPTPVPRRAPDGSPFVRYANRFVSLFPWVEGSHLAKEEVGPADARAVGTALASLHRAGSGLAPRFQRSGIYTFADITARFEAFRDSEDPALRSAIDAIGAEIDWMRAQEDVRRRASRGLIHGDLFPDNVFFADGEIVALIDFEQASIGSHGYDLAVCINAWCFEKDYDPSLVGAMVAGYQGVRELSAADALFVEARAAAMRFTVTRITDAYFRATGIPGKNFRRYLERLLRLREVGEDGFRDWAGV